MLLLRPLREKKRSWTNSKRWNTSTWLLLHLAWLRCWRWGSCSSWLLSRKMMKMKKILRNWASSLMGSFTWFWLSVYSGKKAVAFSRALMSRGILRSVQSAINHGLNIIVTVNITSSTASWSQTMESSWVGSVRSSKEVAQYASSPPTPGSKCKSMRRLQSQSKSLIT